LIELDIFTSTVIVAVGEKDVTGLSGAISSWVCDAS